jgi:ORF6N domain
MASDESSSELPAGADRAAHLPHRGNRVMVDSDLASLYDVATGALNRAVNRNIDPFPEDFCFQLTDEELEALRFQTGISNKGRDLPYVFTEQGVAMLASVLNNPRAVQVSIGIVRVFVRLRAILSTHAELGRRLDEFEPAETGTARQRAPLL